MDNLSVEELMKPRYKVIADYPGSDWGIGSIIENYIIEITKGKEKAYDEYPAIFKKLQWWEERKESDMPQYVKNKNETQFVTRVHKVAKWDFAPAIPECFFERHWRIATQLIPATKEEYENQK